MCCSLQYNPTFYKTFNDTIFSRSTRTRAPAAFSRSAGTAAATRSAPRPPTEQFSSSISESNSPAASEPKRRFIKVLNQDQPVHDNVWFLF